MDFEPFKNLSAALQSLATITAMSIGGVWTYFLFVKNRQRFPKANIDQTIDVVDLPSEKLLVHVSARVSNTGKVLVSINSAKTRIQRIVPVEPHIRELIDAGSDPVPAGKHEVPWPMIGKREWTFHDGEAEIEPGEAEILDSEYIINNDTETIVVYTYIKNHSKREKEIGWSKTSICNLNERTAGSDEAK
jgi:hypothetical protein